MKKLLFSIITLLVMIPIVNADGKVKVYLFEAGGCPYCEAEMDYLKNLDSYNKKFEVIRKELYVDHVNWENGKDYDLGVKVANVFNEAGFENATYQATPFVVISDLYAASNYNTSLEDIINKAYEEGDKDIVSCIANGNDNCLNKPAPSNSNTSYTVRDYRWTVIICSAIIIMFYMIKSNKDKVEIINSLTNK